MPTYKAPLDDIRFLLDDVLDAAQLAALPGYADATPDVLGAVMDERGMPVGRLRQTMRPVFGFRAVM